MKTLKLNKPHVIMMLGIPGAGKSYFAKKFAETFETPIISFGDISKKLFATKAGRTKNIALKRVGTLMANELLKTGQTFVYDGNFDNKAERKEFVSLAQKAGFNTSLIWVQTESATAKERVTKKRQMSVEEFVSAVEHFAAPQGPEKPIVVSGKHTYASQLRIVLKYLTQERAGHKPTRTDPTQETFNRRIAIK